MYLFFVLMARLGVLRVGLEEEATGLGATREDEDVSATKDSNGSVISSLRLALLARGEILC